MRLITLILLFIPSRTEVFRSQRQWARTPSMRLARFRAKVLRAVIPLSWALASQSFQARRAHPYRV